MAQSRDGLKTLACTTYSKLLACMSGATQTSSLHVDSFQTSRIAEDEYKAIGVIYVDEAVGMRATSLQWYYW